jgi:hypothetical protein
LAANFVSKCNLEREEKLELLRKRAFPSWSLGTSKEEVGNQPFMLILSTQNHENRIAALGNASAG